MNASKDERSETPSSMEQLESIALEALQTPPSAPAQLSLGLGENLVQAASGNRPNIIALRDAEPTGSSHPDVGTRTPDAQQIDDYCDSRRLGIPARLQLFAQVCRLVHVAHQHAIIHGNLMPSNIFVAPDGAPKLTDSRSARLAHPESAGRTDELPGVSSQISTQNAESMATPAYASPEQLKGETITTASDTYALGVVLYELLTSRSPYRLQEGTSSDVFQAVFEQAPEKPSSAVIRRTTRPLGLPTSPNPTLAEIPPAEPSGPDLSLSAAASQGPTPKDIAAARGCSPQRLKRILTGDLDAIVLVALRKEPERRYASAEHFADDLSRYLQRMPVRAHEDSTIYRCGKFVRRHTALVATGLLVIVAFSLLISAGMTGLMRAHRQQHRALTNLKSAHENFNEIFSRIIRDRLLNQPGFYPLRAALLEDARRFYKEVLDQHGASTTPRAELIEARCRLAKITSLLGPISEAIPQYRQAIALWESLLVKEPTNRHYQEELAATLSDLGMLIMPMGDQLDEAARIFRRAQQLTELLLAAEPQSVSKRQELALILLNVAQIQRRQDQPDEALESIDRVLAIASQLAAEDLYSLESRILLATAYASAGQILGPQTGELHQALAFYHQAIEIHETIAQEHPELADQSYQFAYVLSQLSKVQQKLGQVDLAFHNLHRSLSIFEQLNRSYPAILLYQRGLGSVYNVMSDLQRQRAETADSLAHAQKARALFDRLVTEYPRDSDIRIDLAQSYNNLGQQLQQMGESSEALRSFQRAMDLYESLPDLDAQTACKLARTVSRCIPLLGTGNKAKADERTRSNTSKGDQLRRQLYGDRAIAALRRALQTGHFNPEMLETDTDLDAIRNRSDFQNLVKELDSKPSHGNR